MIVYFFLDILVGFLLVGAIATFHAINHFVLISFFDWDQYNLELMSRLFENPKTLLPYFYVFGVYEFISFLVVFIFCSFANILILDIFVICFLPFIIIFSCFLIREILITFRSDPDSSLNFLISNSVNFLKVSLGQVGLLTLGSLLGYAVSKALVS